MCNLRSLEAMEQGIGEREGDAGSQAGELRPWITVGVPAPALDLREAQPGGCEDGSGQKKVAGEKVRGRGPYKPHIHFRHGVWSCVTFLGGFKGWRIGCGKTVRQAFEEWEAQA